MNDTPLITIRYEEYKRMLRTHKQVTNEVLSNLNNVLIHYQKDYPNSEIDNLIMSLLNYIKVRMYEKEGKNND